jgi:hypothetical protein
VNRALNRLSLFLLFFVQGVLSYAANPDLISAPIPVLSQTAWQELERQSSIPTTVKLHAQITASRGFVSSVIISEANQWPISAAETQAWISRRWKFVAEFSGTVVQPVSFRVVRAQATPTPTKEPSGTWGGPTEQAIFLKAPSPSFPDAYSLELDNYIRQTHYMAGVLLEVTARKGETVDIRIIDQKGPKRLAEYTVTWVRKHWVFRPNISGTYQCPVYYRIAH